MGTQERTAPLNGTADADALVRRARDVISGGAPAQPLARHPQVESLLAKVGRANYSQETIDWLYLQFHYGGQPVACFTTPDGRLTVLARGDEIAALMPRLTDDEQRMVVLEYPPVPVLADEVESTLPAPERETSETEKAARVAAD